MALGWEPNSPTRYSIDGSCMRVDRDGLSLVALAQLLDEVVNTKREVLQRFSPMDPTVLLRHSSPVTDGTTHRSDRAVPSAAALSWVARLGHRRWYAGGNH